MRFGNLDYLWLLPLVPLLGLFYAAAFKRRRAAMARVAFPPLWQALTSGVSTHKQKVKPLMVVAAVGLMICALLEPMWGYHHVKVERQGLDIVVAIDTSRSMLTKDVSPTRMDAAKFRVIDLLRVLEGDRIGLIAFAGEAYIKCPLTEDYDTAALLLKGIEVGTIPQGSTKIGKAIQRGISAFHGEERRHKMLVLITDGEDHDSNPLEAAAAAGREGIVIVTVGIGTREGDYIVVKDERGKESRLKDRRGNYVKSRLNEGLLSELVAAADGERANLAAEIGREAEIRGIYIPPKSPDWSIERLYDEVAGRLGKKKLGPRWVKKYHNRYQWPLFLGLVLLAVEAVMSEGTREEKSKRRRRWERAD